MRGLSGLLFEIKVMKEDEFYKLGKVPICVNNMFCDTEQCKRALTSDDEKSEFIDKANFFEFSLRLGAIITYELLQAIRYSQPQQQQPQYDFKINSKLRNERMYKYIENALRPSSLIPRFKDLRAVYRRLKPRSEYVTTVEHERDLPSFLELQDGKFEELEKIYRRTFRELFEDLEKIRTA